MLNLATADLRLGLRRRALLVDPGRSSPYLRSGIIFYFLVSEALRPVVEKFLDRVSFLPTSRPPSRE